MNPEELFEKLICNQISREEFELLLDGFDDEDIVARYEIYLQAQFEKEVEEHLLNSKENSEVAIPQLKVIKGYVKEKDSIFKKKGRLDFPIAAVFVFLIGLIFSVLFIIAQFDKKSQTQELAKVDIFPQDILKSTPHGRKFRMTLEDGSFIHLNSASSVEYPNKFKDSSRDIKIHGEAYFNIQRDEARPFGIEVKKYKIEVLGTSFNIKAYDDEDDFSVTVESGSVKVILDEKSNNIAILEKDQKLIYNPETNVTEIINVSSEEELGWRKGILKFNKTPLASVEKTLERWYGIDLVINNQKLYNKTLTGIHQNKNINSVIEALTYATGSTYTIKNNTIILK